MALLASLAPLHSTCAHDGSDKLLSHSCQATLLGPSALVNQTPRLISNRHYPYGSERMSNIIGVGFKGSGGANLSLGYSHPVLKEGKEAELFVKETTATRKVAQEVRGYRPPEPYKSNGIKFADDVSFLKSTKGGECAST